jgi:putative effector of murein hydrolase
MNIISSAFFAGVAPQWIAAGCFVLTVVLYFGMKRVYSSFKKPFLAPFIVVPALLIGLLVIEHIPYVVYFQDTRWLLWLLGPATVAFAVPIYRYRTLMARHWISLAAGVTVGIIVAVGGSLIFAKLLHLSPELQRSLMTRSISTPFALAVSDKINAPKDLSALFVIGTGMCGMLFGELVLAFIPVKTRLAHGALWGASAHAVGISKARELGGEELVAASLTMTITGIVMVLIAPVLPMILPI